FTEQRDGGLTATVGVLSGLAMTLKTHDPDSNVTTVGTGRVEFERIDTVDVKLGTNNDKFSVGGDAVFNDLPVNRRQNSDNNPIITFVHGIPGETLIEAGAGADTVGV